MSADVTTDDLHVTKAVLYLDLGQSQLLQSLFAQDQRGSKSTCKVFKLHSFKQMKSYIPVIYFYPPLPPSLVVEALLILMFICRSRHCVCALFPGVYPSDAYYSVLDNNIETDQ